MYGIVALLSTYWINDADLARMASVRETKKLDLSFTLVTDAGFERLRQLPAVEELNLASAELLTDTAIGYIRGWNKLRVLNVRGTDITDTSMEHIGHLTALESLDISYTQVTNNGMEHLAALTRLETLSMGGNKITGPALHVLKSLPRLKHLNLSGAQKRNSGTWATALTDGDLEIIAALQGLESLNIGGMRFTGAGLARLGKLHNLRRLDLARSRIGPADLAALAAMPRLERLGLWQAKRIDDSAVIQLSALRGLNDLDVAETGMTPAGVEALGKALPSCVVRGSR